jgi:hypothetical protein
MGTAGGSLRTVANANTTVKRLISKISFTSG